METKWKVTLIALVAVVVILIAVSNNQTTGNATFTSGANYGAINPGFSVYTQCIYLDLNDGWDVTKKECVKFYDRTAGKYTEYCDACSGQNSVSETHCEDGYRKTRLVNCPSDMHCVDGACVGK